MSISSRIAASPGSTTVRIICSNCASRMILIIGFPPASVLSRLISMLIITQKTPSIKEGDSARQYFLRSSIQLSQYSTMRMQTLMPAITDNSSFPAILNTTVAAAPTSTYR